MKFYAFAALALIAHSAAAHATACQAIKSLPATLEKPGCYRLAKSLQYDEGDAITVKSADVTLDLAGNVIKGSGSLSATANGIYANSANNLFIQNGVIEGFFYGIRVDSSENVRVKSVTARNNRFRGIAVDGESAKITGNKVLNTGKTKVYEDAFAAGIEVMGNRCLVEGNDIKGVYPVGIGEGLGISLSHKRDGCVVRNNRIVTPRDSNATFGIWVVLEGRESLIENNHIEGFVIPLNYRFLRDDITPPPPVSFKGNTGKNLGCGQDNYPAYFAGIPAGNKLQSDGKPCPALISETFKRYRAKPDKYNAFLVANAKHWCEADPRPDDAACCQQKYESLLFFEKSAELGLAEAKRVLEPMRKRTPISPACKRSHE